MFEQVSVEVGGRKLTFETGKMARQAHGAVVARYGDTVVLSTACMDNKATDKDFLPLTVDYREYTYSAGKIPGGFFKREGRPSEREILTSRLTDRPLRPLFPEGYSTETQIVSMVLSADSENDPDVIGLTAASAALFISKIPFETPIAAVRVGLIDGKLMANPTVAEQKTSLLNLVVAGSEEAIVMVESGALEVSEDTVVDALEFAHAEIRKIVAAIRELHKRVNPEKVKVTPPAFDEALYNEIKSKYGERLRDALDTAKHPKSESYGLVDTIKAEIMASIPEDDEARHKLAYRAFERLREQIFRDDMLLRRRRPDARAFDQIRQITCEVGVSAARSRLGAIYSRRDAGACYGHPGHQRRHATAGSAFRRRGIQAVHASLQFSAVFGWRSEISPRARPPRNRPRCSRRTRACQSASAGSRLSVCDASRIGHHGIQRFLFDGDSVRRVFGADGCGRTAQIGVRGHCDGFGGRRR